MVQLDLNLMLTCTVPARKNARFVCAQPGTHVFADLHTNKNPSRVLQECTVHARSNLST